MYGSNVLDMYTAPLKMSASEATDLGSEIGFYPNPVQDEQVEMILKNNTEFPVTVIFYNTVGEMILSESINDVKQSVNISSLPAGTYVVQVVSGDKKMASGKLI